MKTVEECAVALNETLNEAKAAFTLAREISARAAMWFSDYSLALEREQATPNYVNVAPINSIHATGQHFKDLKMQFEGMSDNLEQLVETGKHLAECSKATTEG